MRQQWTRGKAVAFACGHQEPLADYPEIIAVLDEPQGLDAFVKRLVMPEGVDCSRCSPNTAEYWALVARMITSNAGRDWPIASRQLGPVRPRAPLEA
ncbi:MAG: hypothetical protein ACR2PL_22195 [Dehalococcoidia bacterium]